MNRFTALIMCVGLVGGQVRIGDWDSFTSPLKVRMLVEIRDTVFNATDGGILRFETETSSFKTFTNLHGLSGTDLAAIAKDLENNIWVGGSSPDGFINIFDPIAEEVIATFDYDLSEILDFAVSDSVVFGAMKLNQDLGIIEFRLTNSGFEYRDVYKNWPVSISSISGIAVRGDSLLVGTDAGLFSANWVEDNLKGPATWGRPFSSLTDNVNAVSLSNDTVFVVLGSSIYRIANDGLSLVLSGSNEILDISNDRTGSFWAVTENSIFHGSNAAASPSFDLTSLLVSASGKIFAGTEQGIAEFHESSYTFSRWIPNAPLTNYFSAICVLNDGRIVAGGNAGLAIRETAGWRNIVENYTKQSIKTSHDYDFYTADTLKIDFGDFVADIEQGPDGMLYLAIRGTYPFPRQHGGGIVIMDVDDPETFTLIDTAYLDWNLDEHMSVKDIEFDADGNLWAANTYATHDLDPIAVRSASGNWGNFSASESGGDVSLTPNSLAFDGWGRLWIGSFEDDYINPAGVDDGGLAMLAYEGDPDNPMTKEWASLTVSSSHSNTTVWSLGVTSSNVLYILSPVGLTGIWLQASNSDPESYRGFTYFPNIPFGSGSRIKIDPSENIWAVSASEGIHVLTSGATYWPDINGLNVDNSFLLSNEITDIDFDEKRGIAYVTTSKGINAIKIPFADQKSSYSSIDVFPSPFHTPSDKSLVIDGLTEGSSVMIMTFNGNVLKKLDEGNSGVSGYQAFWDGKDSSGRYVGSGVYLIAIYGTDGSSAFEKITLIRH
ncbi:MAG: hypothetical protein HOD97_06435 [Candidatus Marinimicrobia bacterium]|jgi:ligand-binding sensor domain-containing protein|nr:hypothetical protein [Candidatus Neomarinimicrobiota bacterium]MBT3617166.1 hypothetical protein [Candidatus Neomarinimicrobiota bacterium]MBT3829797.1 hypothetical protein [Candidatus Neomarinimicrobiota bacterium]MBT3997856.1 hypothetical protein [Candidatus Neomarinimicrobiota bacterium]MBT4281234.1 hypothetical protein [Candidatus Neomarinimicrobiota bacterium]